MAIFNRNNKKQENIKNEKSDFTYLDESAYTNSISDIKGIPMYNFINAMKLSNNNEFFYGMTYDRMMDDAIISSAVDLYVDDATQVDPSTKKVCWVEVDMPDDKVESELSKGLVQELNNFLDEIQIQKMLPQIARRVIVHGDAPVKVSFVDKLEDDRLTVHKLNEAVDISGIENKHITELESHIDLSNKPVTLNEYTNSLRSNKRVINKYNNKLLESINHKMNESSNLSYKDVLPGRWYIEILGNGSNLCALESKGKVIALLDKDDNNNVITKDNIAFFMNPKSTKVTVEVGDYLASADKREYYTVSKGDSYLKNARIAWQVLSALEDILLLTRMTRSILYRIFSVEVANKGNKETVQILNQLKNKIKMDETVDVKQKIYNSTISQVPLGDSIFIPTRNGVGAIKVDTVGGDFNLRDAIDLDYFKDKLFAALKIPRSFLGFEDDMPGSLGNTSLVRMDIRYARTVRGIQNILCDGIRDIIDIYLKYTRTEKVLNELPSIRVIMTSINTSEDAERIESEKTKMETVDKVVETLSSLGVDPTTHLNVRNDIITKYFGSQMLDLIKKDEESGSSTPNIDDVDVSEPKTKSKPSFSSSSPVEYTGDEDKSSNSTGSSKDDLIGGEDNTKPSTTSSEDNSNEPPQDIPYSLK